MTLGHHNIPGNSPGSQRDLLWQLRNCAAQTVEQWAKSCIQKLPFSALKDTVIGVDASHYLDLRLNGKDNEPLINALCGAPYALQGMIEHDLEILKKHDIKLIFVFDGLDFVNKGQRIIQTATSRGAHEEAWQHYLSKDAEKSLADFGQASQYLMSPCANILLIACRISCGSLVPILSEPAC
jgi:XPG N-terminal domain